MTQTPKRFIVRDTTPCYVSRFYEVEADNEVEAYDTYFDGATSAPVAMEVGDSTDLEWAGEQETIVIEHIPATASNERLAAAAPELLAALEAAFDSMAPIETNSNGEAAYNPIYEQARAAIAKAKGD